MVDIEALRLLLFVQKTIPPAPPSVPDIFTGKSRVGTFAGEKLVERYATEVCARRVANRCPFASVSRESFALRLLNHRHYKILLSWSPQTGTPEYRACCGSNCVRSSKMPENSLHERWRASTTRHTDVVKKM